MLREGEEVRVYAGDDLVRLTWAGGRVRAELLTRRPGSHAGWTATEGRHLWTAPSVASLPPVPRPGSLAQAVGAVSGASGGEARALDLLRRKCGQARAAELAVVHLLRDERAVAASEVVLDVPVPEALLEDGDDRDGEDPEGEGYPPWDED